MNAARRCCALSVAGGVVFALTAPPTDLYPAVIVGLALFATSIGVGPASWPDPPSFFYAFGRGAAWGTAAGIVGLRFVPVVIQRFTDLGTPLALLALVLLAAAQSLLWAVGAGVAAVLHRRAGLPFEIAFGVGVLATLSLPTIFAWSPAGLVSPWPSFVQFADLIGERGVSVLFAIGAASLARAGVALVACDPRAALRPVLAGAALFALLSLHGTWRIASVTRSSVTFPVLRVGLVSQAVAPRDRWNSNNHPAILQSLRDLTRRVEAEGVDLTIWPEAAYPYPLDHEGRTAPGGRRALLGKGVRGPLLIGLITVAKPEILASGEIEHNSYNSATLVLPDGSLEVPYDKLQLLWFGEMVPGGGQVPWLRRLFQRSGGIIPGDAPRALDLPAPLSGGPPAHLAVLNCYEDTLPGLGRRLAAALAPSLLVNITNDAWFDGTAEPDLHARLSVMRAIEQRRDLVRAVNLGVSSWIDAAGVVRARYAGATAGTLLAAPAVRKEPLTFYARWGDAPLYGLFAMITTIFAGIRRREQSAAG
jgi:apolipoprotein N-acyltransferase